MKKTQILIMILFLIIPIQAKAETTNELHEYAGYAEMAYNNVVKLKSYLHGTTTGTKHYVTQIASELTGVSVERLNEIMSYNVPDGDGFLKSIGGALLKGTLSIWNGSAIAAQVAKDIFGLLKEEVENEYEYDLTFFDDKLIKENNYKIAGQNGYGLRVKPTTCSSTGSNGVFSFVKVGDIFRITVKVADCATRYVDDISFASSEETLRYIENATATQLFLHLQKSPALEFAVIVKGEESYNSVPKTLPVEHTAFFETINNNTNNYTINEQALEKLISSKMYCGNTIYDIQFNNGGFYYLDTLLDVDKVTMLTTYQDEECTVGFVENDINYIGDKVVIQTEDRIIDVQTGETLDQDGNVIEQLEPMPECDGILCWVSNIFGKIASLVSSIADLGKTLAGLVTDLVDAIFHLIVPEDLDFISGLFDGMKNTFTEKFQIATDLQQMFNSFFVPTDTNPLDALSFTLPATDTEVSFSVFNVIDPYVPMIKRILSAIIGLMTLMYVYRKITGSGGVMEK